MDAARNSLSLTTYRDIADQLRKTFSETENRLQTIELADNKPEGEVYSPIIFEKFP